MFLMGSIGSTMFDWFLQLAARLLNYYDEVTVSFEKIVSESSTRVPSLFSKIKRFMKDVSDSIKKE